MDILRDIKRLITRSGLIRTIPKSYRLYRARPRKPGKRFTEAGDLASPPVEYALQSNRMNPPDIPMFYGAESRKLAVAEVRNSKASIGRFRTTRKIRILDLANLPPMPGFFFSGVSRNHRLYLSFLHAFTREIIKPVPREERTQFDYLPTQVFTGYLRDAPFGGKRIEGIRYASATGKQGAIVVLFAKQEDFVGVGEDDPHFVFRRTRPSLSSPASRTPDRIHVVLPLAVQLQHARWQRSKTRSGLPPANWCSQPHGQGQPPADLGEMFVQNAHPRVLERGMQHLRGLLFGQYRARHRAQEQFHGADNRQSRKAAGRKAAREPDVAMKICGIPTMTQFP